MAVEFPAPPRTLGFWRVRYLYRGVRNEAPLYGLSVAWRKHFNYLQLHRAAQHIPPLAPRTGTPLPVHFLTGKDHWQMTVFCAYSLLLAAPANIIPVIHDDGTLTTANCYYLQRALPQLQIVRESASVEKLDHYLPASRFPSLRELRTRFKLMYKLLDVHGTGGGPALSLDSDMLFFREPAYLLNWLRAPARAVYMQDYMNSYGYSSQLLERELGGPMPEMVNTGICGLLPLAIDWERLEHWTKQLLAAEGVNHFTEQALTAMALGGMDAEPAPAREYLVYPAEQEARHPTAIMHHYVAESRNWYYMHGWRHTWSATLRAS